VTIYTVNLVQAMYIRVKRSKTTYFIRCDPTETILGIKEKLHVLADQPVNNQRLILVGTGEILEDSKTLADQKVSSCHYNLLFDLLFLLLCILELVLRSD
jgi:hypothetical protein